MKRGEKGFTIIELLIVLVIVGILASIAAPIMRGNVDKARRSEAVTALGTIRTAERLYFSENSGYVNVAAADWATNAHNLNNYIKPGDLNGQYYNQGDYNVVGATVSAFNATAANIGGRGVINMDQAGSINGY